MWREENTGSEKGQGWKLEVKLGRMDFETMAEFEFYSKLNKKPLAYLK